MRKLLDHRDKQIAELKQKLENATVPLESADTLMGKLTSAKKKRRKALKDLDRLQVDYAEVENKLKMSEDHVLEKESVVANLTNRVVELESLLGLEKKKTVEEVSGLRLQNANLEKQITCLSARVSELFDDNNRLREDRRWFAKNDATHAFETLRVSHEYLESLGAVQVCSLEYGKHEGVKVGYHNCLLGTPMERSLFYDSDAESRMDTKADALAFIWYPYMEKLSENCDITIQEFLAIKPANAPSMDTSAPTDRDSVAP